MPYVPLRGNQILIVHGEREPGTGEVEQRILFTLKAEAEARKAAGSGAGSFEHLGQFLKFRLDTCGQEENEWNRDNPFQLDQPRASLASFLHGALNRPRTARMLAGKGTKRVAGSEDARDHNTGVDLLRSFGSFLEGPGRDTRRFFARALAEPGFAALLEEQAELRRRDEDERAKRIPPPSETFRLLSKRRELAFARERATTIADFMGLPPERPVLANRPSRKRRLQ